MKPSPLGEIVSTSPVNKMLPSAMLSQYSVNISASIVILVQLPYYILMGLSSEYKC